MSLKYWIITRKSDFIACGLNERKCYLYKSLSFCFSVKFITQNFNSIVYFVHWLGFNPLSDFLQLSLSFDGFAFSGIKKVDENLMNILLIKNSIDRMTAK